MERPALHTAEEISRELQRLGNRRDASFLQGFFKTGPGQYGEGDVFLGIRVPQLRLLLRRCDDLDLAQTEALLHSPIHEQRLFALLVLVREYRRGDAGQKQRIYRLYLRNTRFINNWDLVDSSAEYIVGAQLQDRSRAPLYRLARSRSVWERRIAIIATFHYIRTGECSDTLALAEQLLGDREDLIHKAVGWMLREVGKRCGIKAEEGFLKRHCTVMPRTMLRYAIERFPETERRRYLNGSV
jgi:3-methyladenine DNA glycosylase AlkD